MSYVRHTGREYARRRRERRAHYILVIVGVALLGVFGYSVAYAMGAVPGSRIEAGPGCTTTITRPPQSRVLVNVYNASAERGQASALRRSLLSRDFRIGAIGNDPYKQKVTGAGQVRVGPAGEQFARAYVLPLVPGATLVVDGRTDTSSDIVIGDRFQVPSAVARTEQPPTTCKTERV